MRSYHHCPAMFGIVLFTVWSHTCLLRAEIPLVDPDNWTLENLSVVDDGGSALNINATFAGKPWVEYAVFATTDFANWTPLGLAPETIAGEYFFHHSSAASRQFYRAEIGLPGPIKTLDAHYYAGIAGLCAAAHRFGVAFNRETEHAIAGGVLNLEQGIEQASQALLGGVNVVELEDGSFHVSWAGSEQIANDEAERDAAVQHYGQQRSATQTQLQQAQNSLIDLENLLLATLPVEPLAVAGAKVSDCEKDAITTYLPRPTGAAYLVHEAPLAWFDLDTVMLDKAAVENEKAALLQRIGRLRQEAARKRDLADGAVQVFGVNGDWFVRWANVELTYPTQAEAETAGVDQINALKARRLAEADALDAEADALETQLPALDAKLADLDATLAVLDPAYQAKLAAHPGGAPNPVDTAHPQPRWGRWIGFPPEYIDDVWLEMYREWQAHKDALRARLITYGASPAEIEEQMQRMDGELDPKQKLMYIFRDEPIKLQLYTVNQFTDFTVDTENAKWVVEYENDITFQIERVEVGTGA